MDKNERKKIRVCHFTSAHSSSDVRIFHKECVSLAKAGYEVFLVAPGTSREEKGVRVIGVGEKPTKRLQRMTFFARNVYKHALALDCDIYHLHDPELLPYGLKLKRKGKCVIFDSHENVAKQILQKRWIPGPTRSLISWWFSAYENYTVQRFNAVIGVSPGEEWEKLNKTNVLITNYPLLQDNQETDKYNEYSDYICYAGGIRPDWNHETIVKALQKNPGIRYELYGKAEEIFLNKLRSIDTVGCLDYKGIIPHESVHNRLKGALAGIAVPSYVPNAGGKKGSLGNNKIFEIMAAGIPIIATDFVTWKSIIDNYQCGICIQPEGEDALASAIQYILKNRTLARFMGENGRRAVEQEFNWGKEEKKLLKLYEDLTEIKHLEGDSL